MAKNVARPLPYDQTKEMMDGDTAENCPAKHSLRTNK